MNDPQTEITGTPSGDSPKPPAAVDSSTPLPTIVPIGIWQQIKEHKVVQWTLAYLALAYTLLHGAEMLREALDWSHTVIRVFTLGLIIGVPLVAVLAWYHGSRSQRRVSIMEFTILSALLTVGGLLLWTTSKLHKDEGAPAAKLQRPAVQEASIAVLAFADMSPAKDQEYFSDGMAEEIINSLVSIEGLKVAGRTSSFSFKGKNIDLKSIGETLSVANILEGSVRKQGDRVRITAQLVRANDGFHVWSNTYDATLTDIFDLQERLAREITSRLKVVLASGGNRLVAKATDNPEAYTLFVEAQSLVNRRIEFPRAIELLTQATTLDPNFSRAWSKLAVANVVAPQYTAIPWKTGWTAGETAANHALALDPASAESYAALGYMYLSERRFIEMGEAFTHALKLNANDPTALHWASNGLEVMGRTGAAEMLIDQLLRSDPVNPLALQYKSILRYEKGDTAAALKYSQAAIGQGFRLGHISASFANAALGAYDAATTDFVAGWGSINTSFSASELATIFHGADIDVQRRATARAVVDNHRQDDLAPSMYLYLSEPAQAFTEFELRKTGLSDAFFVLLWHPLSYSRRARQDPSFQGFAQRLGMINYWKKYGWPDLCHPTPDRGPESFVCD